MTGRPGYDDGRPPLQPGDGPRVETVTTTTDIVNLRRHHLGRVSS